jgi:hypothetical protein
MITRRLKMTKVTYKDIQDATQKELKKTYKLDDRGMEKALRNHLDGANAQERRQEYDKFYRKR